MADYSKMDHEELGAAADPLSRIINKDVAILGYLPTDDEVTVAQAEYDKLNEAGVALNVRNPRHASAVGPEYIGLPEDEIKLVIDHRLEKRRVAQGKKK